MPTFALIGSLGHIISAFLFAGIAVWALLRPSGGMRRRSLAGAALVTVLWSASVVVEGDISVLAQVFESLRNLAWLGLMLLLLVRGRRGAWHPALVVLYGVLGTIVVAEIGISLITPGFAGSPRIIEAFIFVAVVLRMTVAIGALVLVHNLYTAAAPEARWGIRLPMAALAGMWVFDLNLYTIAYLTNGPVDMLFSVRGVIMVIVAGIIALGSRRNTQWKMRVSRAITFQSLSLLAIGGYLVMMVLVVRALDVAGIGNIQLAQSTVIIGMSALGIALFPSQRLRAWLKVKLVKHFFKHRYDYRVEWMRFTETLGRPNADAAPLDERIIKAIADITESPGGLLMLPDEHGGLTPAARWCWPSLEAPTHAASDEFAQYCEAEGRIIELDAVRRGHRSAEDESLVVPEWMIESPRVWAAVPLIHFGKLTGIVLLERPLVDRMLDWEDFDLLRLAGRQVASYLAEARGQEELLDAKRFDEFNRRFAFIMHDIKNLVSQLTLLARNAERHAENPDFRADMVATLKNSVGKMNDLLARLSQHNRGRIDELRAVSLRAIVDAVAANKRGAHALQVEGRPDIVALADPLRLEQALAHLIQNAIDASDRESPVAVSVTQKDDQAVITVADRGRGMSPEFLRNRLFRPFASTKEGGFGIGAYEARTLIAAMDGRIEVTSREGEGSRFEIRLPAAPANAVAESARKIAS
jgi:putative PEP-CTERM system histidine kinase